MSRAERKQYMLQELLSQEQEPFLLHTFISHNHNWPNYNYSTPNTPLQFHKHLCNSSSSCFPTATAATNPQIFPLLLQAALRIHKHRSNSPKSGFGILGSFFKRLITQRGGSNKKKRRRRRPELTEEDHRKQSDNKVKVKVMDILNSSESDSCSVSMEKPNGTAVHYMETSSCGCACFDDDESGFFFCETPLRFPLHLSPSSSSASCCRTPASSSPSRPITEDKEISSKNGADSINEFQSRDEEELEEEKEQCSPVSVLDPPFDDDDDDDVHGNDYEDHDFDDLECSYANVQRTRQQLLYKLRRFEKLADLDPLKLEKRILEQEENGYGTLINEEHGCEDDNSEASCEGKISSTRGERRFPEDLKRLVSDLIAEEEIREHDTSEDMDIVTERVCRRLELWEEVDSNTIDMMVDDDFSREEGLWKKNAQVSELARELEVVIFGFLVEEFLEELGSSKK